MFKIRIPRLVLQPKRKPGQRETLEQYRERMIEARRRGMNRG